ncbi:MAG: hypothetical protein OEX01_06755 [Candidatus Bathyarchaeota archaeon]|nr:hypothetical protein [Candidatus Bathyarchaeota archaeon]
MREPSLSSVKEGIFRTIRDLKKKGYAESTYHIVPKKLLGKPNFEDNAGCQELAWRIG